ncbi:unnamed protein product [Ceutorhynchus assimilis]|uniref:Sugar transporter SWEET1 n=1 Tax=Ceutorhynchus assimilis TaxID=467358 RepID=A0A9N9QJP6_9CUCU|nr:unnamed protein product [Ceutorhynchus assimilis]
METQIEMLVEMASKTLQPYKDLVTDLAWTVTILHLFAGIIVCINISRHGSTRGFTSTPFIGATAIAILFLQYGLILEQRTLRTMILMSLAADAKNEVLKPIACAVALVAVLLAYVRSDPSDDVEDNVAVRMFGFSLTGLMLFLLGMPLSNLEEIIRRKDASIISFPLTFSNAMVTFFWFLHSVIVRDIFMIVPYGIGFLLCFFQLVLIVLYRP